MADLITVEMVDELAAGAAFLGTGGGGDPYVGALLCKEALRRHGPVRLVPLAEVPDHAAVFTAAGMGAPTILIEKLLSVEDADTAVRALEEHMGRSATHVIAAEVGGVNSTLPIAFAALRGLPLIDADGMGRAFPSLQMTTFSVAGVSCTPLSLSDEWGNTALLRTGTALKAEELARPLVAAFGASATLSCYPMTGEEARRAAVPGSMTAALRIGRALLSADSDAPPEERLLAVLNAHPLYGCARILFEGKISALQRDTTRGWVFGRCEIERLDGGAVAEVVFQNENLAIRSGGRTLAIVPDLITVIDTETGHAIPTESLRYGQRVSVVGCRAPAALRTANALAVMGPPAFGIDEDYAPLGGNEPG